MNTLETLQQFAAQARDLELEITDLEAQIHEKKDLLKRLYFEIMPNLLDALKLDRIGIPANGNKPGRDFRLTPYFSASIAASWDEDKQQRAFDLLKRLKADDLIKTEVTTRFPKGKIKEANKVFQAIKKLTTQHSILKQSVHHQTLTAWLRELYEKNQSLPISDLETLGASVGRKVIPQERDNG